MDDNIIRIRKELESLLPDKRMEHTLGVQYTAAALAMCHGADVKSASLAGLLHDCAKAVEKSHKITECETYGLPISDHEYLNPDILHGKLGAYYVKERYGINDEDILNAITYHTTGRPHMSVLEKIVYIADYIEPNRDIAPNLPELRHMAFHDLDRCIFEILKQTILYLQASKNLIDQISVDAYHYYKQNIGENIDE